MGKSREGAEKKNGTQGVSSYRKGFGYTLEVIIAISMVLIFTVIIFNTAAVPVPASTALIKKQGFEALEYLDQTDELRILVLSGNEVQLRNRLRELLPPGVALDLDICTTPCTANVPDKKTVVSLDYYVSGYRDQFFAKKVRLWMWGNF